MSEDNNQLNGYKYSFNRVNPYIKIQNFTSNSTYNDQTGQSFNYESHKKLAFSKQNKLASSKTARQIQLTTYNEVKPKLNKLKMLKNDHKQLLDIYSRKYHKKTLSQSIAQTKGSCQKIKKGNCPQQVQIKKRQVKKQIKVKPMSSLTGFWLHHPYLSKNVNPQKKLQVKQKNKTSSILIQKSNDNQIKLDSKIKKQLFVKLQNFAEYEELAKVKKLNDFNKTSKSTARKLFCAYDYFTPKSKIMNKNITSNFFKSNGEQKRIKMFTEAQQKQIIQQFYSKIQ